jgi:phage shock protein C
MIDAKQTRRLYRSRTNVVLAGVAAGLADYFAIDPSVVRVLLVVSGVINPLVLLAYLVCALVIPVAPDTSTA